MVGGQPGCPQWECGFEDLLQRFIQRRSLGWGPEGGSPARLHGIGAHGRRREQERQG